MPQARDRIEYADPSAGHDVLVRDAGTRRGSCAAGSGQRASRTRSLLVTLPFVDDWAVRTRGILQAVREDERVLVLLPNDIHLEDYAAYALVRYGSAAVAAFERAFVARDDDDPLVILIDFAPKLWADAQLLLSEVNRALAGRWPRHVRLIVATPNTSGLETELFDARIEL